MSMRSPISKIDIYTVLSLKNLNHRIFVEPVYSTAPLAVYRKCRDHNFHSLLSGVKLAQRLSFQSESSIDLLS